ncbi:MAG: hypothetical protein HN726_01130 [Candidatus Magasanikbacteria bacterium]|jgi:hypothetical protein|nr:hypothetical protein [Candidatus Magasanikbacteria bacterium]MBT4220997.1 hypothetical protein [Candidatus Magasanikbacteria bacterium]MBT4350515.1 hypothetical protein [Candidatus Magasanikbacteria bacterium]MBT4541932.1 hypothetical protein [Candidatus Magasanikbacteria bacterium]MBT6253063.1 hypothetical protein [Candidatus Magasanikbacteria bacterium]
MKEWTEQELKGLTLGQSKAKGNEDATYVRQIAESLGVSPKGKKGEVIKTILKAQQDALASIMEVVPEEEPEELSSEAITLLEKIGQLENMMEGLQKRAVQTEERMFVLEDAVAKGHTVFIYSVTSQGGRTMLLAGGGMHEPLQVFIRFEAPEGLHGAEMKRRFTFNPDGLGKSVRLTLLKPDIQKMRRGATRFDIIFKRGKVVVGTKKIDTNKGKEEAQP